jgi:hypothetical protein
MHKLLTMLLIAATAAPAYAAPIVYECRIDRRGSVKLSDEMRADPKQAERFAIDEEAGKACFLAGPACSPFFGSLTISQKGDSISSGGARVADGKPITLVYFRDRKQAFMTFDTSQVTTRKGDCSATDVKVVIP